MKGEEQTALKLKIELLTTLAKEQQQAVDAIYNAIFNLDCKNPHQVEQFSHAPEELLSQYTQATTRN